MENIKIITFLIKKLEYEVLNKYTCPHFGGICRLSSAEVADCENLIPIGTGCTYLSQSDGDSEADTELSLIEEIENCLLQLDVNFINILEKLENMNLKQTIKLFYKEN